MPSYSFRGTDPAGAEHAGEVQAPSRTAALDVLARRGLSVRSLSEAPLPPSAVATSLASAEASASDAGGSGSGSPPSATDAARGRPRGPMRVGFHPLLLFVSGVVTMLVGLGIAIENSALTGFSVLFVGWITVNAAGWMQRVDLHLRQIVDRIPFDHR